MTNELDELEAYIVEPHRDGTFDIWHGDHKIASHLEPKKVSEIIHKEIAIPANEKEQWHPVWHKRHLRTKHAHE